MLVVSLLAGTLIDQNVIDETGKELLDAAFEACGNHKLVVNFMSSAMLGKLMPLHKRCKIDKTKDEGITEVGWFTRDALRHKIVFPSILLDHDWVSLASPDWMLKWLGLHRADF